jgi:hypothetical protein
VVVVEHLHVQEHPDILVMVEVEVDFPMELLM